MIRPVSDTVFLAARHAYFQEVERFSEALLGRIAAVTLDAFPSARRLEAHGEWGEEFEQRLRAQAVTDARGMPLAGYLDGHTDEWDAFVDEVDSLLDFLAQINGDLYMGVHVFEISP